MRQVAAVEPLADGRAARGGVAFVRIVTGMLWLSQVVWKWPPDFATLAKFTGAAVDHPVLQPWAWSVKVIVLPNIGIFGWVTILMEACLGAFLILGFATRFWALVGLMQTVIIMLSVLHAPNEWSWAYYMMFSLHIVILATAAGRAFGADGLLRPAWQRSQSLVARALVMAS